MVLRPPVQSHSVVARSALLGDFDAVSIDAKNLNALAASDLPRDSSIVFSLRLLAHLATYWDARSVDAEKLPLINYADLFRSLTVLLDETSKPRSDDEFIHQIRELKFLIEPDSFSYYVPGLGGAECLLLGVYHDLAIAMVCYKAAAQVGDPVQRQMLFDHTDCALDKMWSAQRRFKNVRVPTVIQDYVEAIMLKIKIEMARAVHT